MRIERRLEHIACNKAVVSVGTFDGVHRAHQEIIRIMAEERRRTGGEICAVTFDPHPQEVLHSRPHEIRLLTTIDERLSLLERFGVGIAVVIRFDREFSQMPPERFVEDVLVKKLGAACVVVGHDHGFGKGRQGDLELLETLGAKFGFSVHPVDALIVDGSPVSSTRIRRSLEEGEIALANALLGWEYSLAGTVVRGAGRGRELGFPTANLDLPDGRKLVPTDGVYAVRVHYGTDSLRGMLNIGVRPTLTEGLRRTIEVHILDFDRTIYGERIAVEFVRRIRAELKFDSKAALERQLERDQAECVKIFNERQILFSTYETTRWQ